MIDRIAKLYPDYLIFIKRNGKIFDRCNKEVTNKKIFTKFKHVIINDTSYEVHKKIKNQYKKDK